MNTHTETISDLEELLDAEIPCGGIRFIPIARSCTRAATLISHGHGCPTGPEMRKCISCWQIWYQYHAKILVKDGSIRCCECQRNFPSVEAFSDYRPL